MDISTTMWIVIAAAIIAGGGLGIYLGRKNRGQSWETLMESQRPLDELNITDILEWANPYRDLLKDGDSFFLFKATKKNVMKLGYRYIERIDSDSNLIACVINTKSGDITHTQLFTFGEMSDKMIELFAGCDYAVITL